MDKQIKYWDNGNAITVLERCDRNPDPRDWLDQEVLHISCCGLSNYCICFGEGMVDGYKPMTVSQILDLCLTKKIIGITAKFGNNNIRITDVEHNGFVIGDDGCSIMDDDGQPLENLNDAPAAEKAEWIKAALDQGCLTGREMIQIIQSMTFERFVIKNVYAYIHTDVNLSLGELSDKWDSGWAGFAWSDDLTENCLEEWFREFNDIMTGVMQEYHYLTYKIIQDKWILQDDYYNIAEDFDEAWLQFDTTMNDIVDKPAETLYNEIRNREITEKDILDYLGEL